MKRCIFSDNILTDLKWEHRSDHICYSCYARLTVQKLAKQFYKSAISAETVCRVLFQKSQPAKNSKYPNIKIDSRETDEYMPPPSPPSSPHERFFIWLKIEGPMRPKIKYPYISSFVLHH